MPATATSTSTRSTLVDLSKPNVDEEQRENYRRAAELTALIRTLEADGVTVSVGGEIGEVGTQNSTVAELRAYLDGYRRELDALAPGAIGHLQGQRPDRHVARRRPAARRRRGRGQARLRGPARARRGRPRVRAGRCRPARRVDPARRAVPPLPGGRDRRDPPRDRASRTRSTSIPAFPAGAPPRDRGVVLRQRRRRAQARPDRPAVRLHDPQEGDRAVQARSSGSSTRRTRSSPRSGARSPTCSPSCGSTTPATMVERYVQPGRAPSARARRPFARPSPPADASAGSRRSLQSPRNGIDRRIGAILPRRSAAGLREPRGSSPASPCVNSRGQLAPRRCGGRRRARGGTRHDSQDVAARDDAHLRSLGIKPELKRIARVPVELRGGVQLHQRLDRDVHATRPSPSASAVPAIFWAWPLVILGQTFVALNFAELSSHFPVAGSIYQWSKRLSNQTLGWFTGWIYFWAGVHHGDRRRGDGPARPVDDLSGQHQARRPVADRGPRHAVVHRPGHPRSRRRSSTLIGVRLLSIINNIGVGAEIIGMVVFALILLFFANHQSPSVLFDTSYTAGLADGNYFAGLPRRHVHGPVRRLRLRHRRDVRRGDASTPAGRRRAASCRRSGCRASSARSSCSRSPCRSRTSRRPIAEGQAFGFPIADDDQGRT